MISLKSCMIHVLIGVEPLWFVPTEFFKIIDIKNQNFIFKFVNDFC